MRFFKRIFTGKNSSDKHKDSTDIFGNDEIIHTVIVDNVDSILTICQKNYSQPGYTAAKKIPDMQYAQTVLNAIKGKLLNYVRKVERNYNEEKKEIEEKLKHYENEGYKDLANGMQNKLEQLNLEMEQLSQLKIEIDQNTENGVFMQIRESFMVGFKEGMIEHHNLNNISKNL
jgi:hypothetical protein